MENFDTFRDSFRVDLNNFSFKSNRFELWRNQQLFDSGDSPTSILARTYSRLDSNFKKLEVTISNPKANFYIPVQNEFYTGMTLQNRVALLNLPKLSSFDSEELGMFRTLSSLYNVQADVPRIEIPEKLNENQAFACSIFLIKGNIAKVTFSINSPRGLLEFYKD